MMAGYVQDGKYVDALKVLVEMLHFGKSINNVSFTSALAACSNPEFIAQGKIVHGHVLVAGMGSNLIVGNALVTMYGKCSIMFEAKQVFQNMLHKDLVTWNALISGYADNEEPDQAFNFFRLMRKTGESANYITMVNLLGACTLPNLLMKHGMPLHAHAVCTGFEADEFVKNSLITMYARCGDLSSSNCIFGDLVSKNNVTWNTMIAANARHGQGEEALKLFIEMQRFKVKLDQFSLSAALAACANLAILEEGQQIHSLALKLGFESYINVMNTTMDMYSKCGSSMNDILKILPNTNERSKMSWNILISSFARHGRFQEAKETIDEMIRLGVKPDHVTFVSLLSACSHGGLVDKGLEYFEIMSKEFGVTAGIEHCVCIIDLLGRSGRLYEAEKFIEEMKVEPNEFVWRSLLASCRIHGDSELGKKAAMRLLESNPRDDSAYVLYSNVCATSGKWNDVHRVRGEMRWNKVTKQQACSWVKLKNGVSSFGIGDRSHPLAAQIYEKLGEIMRKIKEAGYVADTSFTLQDIDEEQKEANLWNHSERLALAYGLISTPDGYGLRIFKNLRVCGDCHSVFKFVSSVINREIVLRDPYRFHHFNGGKCSCGDYW
jgi:pentatricopeptide repeat protein